MTRRLPCGIRVVRARGKAESETKERDSRIYPRLGSPIMSISNTTNCTQPSGESGRLVVARVVSVVVCAHTSPAEASSSSSSSSSPSPSPCNGLLNSPSKIVLSFQSTRRRYDAPRSTSLPYNFQFPRGLPSKGIDRVLWCMPRLELVVHLAETTVFPSRPHVLALFLSSLSLSLSLFLSRCLFNTSLLASISRSGNASSAVFFSRYLVLVHVLPRHGKFSRVRLVNVFRGSRSLRDIARGIRTRLRSRGLSFVDKRRGVNFVYNLAGEHTRENIVPRCPWGETARDTRGVRTSFLSFSLSFFLSPI